MTLWPSTTSCGLCGDATKTERRLVEWLEPVDGKTWQSISRCVDRIACRRRVETVLRVPWPLNDRTPPSDDLPPENPEPEAEHPPAHVEEEEVVVPWLTR